MKKILFTAALLAAAFAAGFFLLTPPVQAQHDGHGSHEKPQLSYTCAPESFTLTQNGDSYTLSGTLETPTPGYSYDIDSVDIRNGRLKARLALTGVDGVMIQVIGSLDVSHTFEYAGTLHTLHVAIEKTFNWGPEDIRCRH